MELWNGSPVEYSHLRLFGCLAYAHVNQDKLNPRALRCIFIGYLDGVKWYKVWNLEPSGPRFFNSRDISFDASKMGFGMKGDYSAMDKMNDLETQIEVETATDSLQNEDEKHNETSEESSVPDRTNQNPQTYTLAKDKPRRNVKPPQRYAHADLTWYALTVAEEVELIEHLLMRSCIMQTEEYVARSYAQGTAITS